MVRYVHSTQKALHKTSWKNLTLMLCFQLSESISICLLLKKKKVVMYTEALGCSDNGQQLGLVVWMLSRRRSGLAAGSVAHFSKLAQLHRMWSVQGSSVQLSPWWSLSTRGKPKDTPSHLQGDSTLSSYCYYYSLSSFSQHFNSVGTLVNRGTNQAEPDSGQIKPTDDLAWLGLL